MLLVIVIVVVVHLNHQTTEVCPTDVPRPVGPASPASRQPVDLRQPKQPEPTADIRR